MDKFKKGDRVVSLDGKVEGIISKVVNDNHEMYKVYSNGKMFLAHENELKFDEYYQGKNPFNFLELKKLAFTLNSILFEIQENDKEDRYKIDGVGIKNWNWNPYVYKDGKKYYYQRDLVWELKDKQSLINSIYNNIPCGSVVVRKRSFETLKQMKNDGETELFFFDLIDGKQRLSTIIEFMENKFPDSYGNYFKDLSQQARNMFKSNQLISYAETNEDISDEETLQHFLRINVSGVPQSEEHLNFVKSLIVKEN